MPRQYSILLVAQLTPPSVLSGARRPANLAKYLARRGHRVTILTSLASGSGPIAGAAHVLRTRDLLASRLNWRRNHFEAIQGNQEGAASASSRLEALVVPDLSLVGWLPFALPRALELARTERFDCAVTTSPPQSAHLIGLALRSAGVPWVADLRDGWTFDPPRPAWPTAAQEAADRRLERATLARADRVVAVTAPIAGDLGDRLAREVSVITNGFDPEEAGQASTIDGLLRPDRHSLVYTGRAGVSGRSPRPLLDGILELQRRWPEVAERLEVVFAGPTTAEERALLGDERLHGLVRSVGTLERRQALALQEGADSLLVLAEGASGPSVATNKLFEYLAARRPVFVLGEDSEAARIVSQTRAGVVAPGDAVAVAAALRELVEGGIEYRAEGIERFAWPALAERFEAEIEAAVAGG